MKINLQGDEILAKFVEQMMREKGVDSQEEKEQLIEILNDRIDKAIIGALPDDRLVALNEELDEDEPSDKKIDAIIYGSGVDFEQTVSVAMKEFKNEYLGREA